MRLDWFDRLPVNIPTLILILAAGLLVVRIVVSRVGVLRSTWRRSIVETLDASIFAAVLSLIIITFVVQAFYIPSGSMEPTLQIGDRILVSKFSYRLGTIRRGDITVFHFPLSPSRDFVKRVVALPGETVELREGLVLINGKPLSELYPTPLPATAPAPAATDRRKCPRGSTSSWGITGATAKTAASSASSRRRTSSARRSSSTGRCRAWGWFARGRASGRDGNADDSPDCRAPARAGT